MLKKILLVASIFHYVAYKLSSSSIKQLINEDIEMMNSRMGQKRSLIHYLVYNAPYRNLFYYRIGAKNKYLSRILRPYSLFFVNSSIESIGGGAYVLNHPYGTIINAKRIGKNFTVCQLTTIGNGRHGRNDLVPSIGDNVSLGANVNIIGGIEIGDNVVVGAGSVVVKDVPSNCVVAGNPAKIIRYL
jgi:serine acetyltransferase